MSEMTATRIGVGTLLAVWLATTALMWRTQLPPAPDAEPVLAPFAGLDLARAERHDLVLRLLTLGSLAAQLGALALLAWRRPRLVGSPFVRAALLGALAALVLQLARLPFGLTTLWWQRRYGISYLGYAQWLFDRLGPLAVRAALLAFAAAFCLWLASRLGRRWWLAATPVFAVAGVGVILAQPLLTPRLEPAPRGVVEQVAALAAREGLDRPEVEVRRTRGRTRQISAEAIGIGPTTRVILWGTAVALPADARGFLVAHELGHVSREHLWKGLVWFVVLLVPGLALLASIAPLRDADDVPRVLVAAFVLLALATPVANTLTRRYEAEADRVALATTRDPRGATRLFVRMAAAGVRDPDPPRWWGVVFGTHPSLAERAGAVIPPAGPPPGGS
jgi:STE24 endopeptidase